MKNIILAALLGTALTSTSVFGMEDEEISIKSSGSKRLAPTGLVDERDLKNQKIENNFIPTNGIVTEEHELDETQPLPPTHYRKYMMLPEHDRDSIEARSTLLKKWESITFRDYTIEDKRRPDWTSLTSEVQAEDDRRCVWDLEIMQSRFIPGNGKRVRMSGDLVLAILDREDCSFYKDGNYFRLIPIEISHPLVTYEPFYMTPYNNSWVFETYFDTSMERERVEPERKMLHYRIDLIEDGK